MKYIKVIFLAIIVLFTGCTQKNECKQDFENSGDSSIVVEDDFELTISTAKNVYNMEDLFTTNPLDITATVRYLGNEDEITIYHGEPIVAISLRHKNGKLQLNTDNLDILCSSVIQSKKEYLFSQDYIDDYYKECLIKGDYVAVAFISIALDKEFTHKIEFSAEVPFSIE